MTDPEEPAGPERSGERPDTSAPDAQESPHRETGLDLARSIARGLAGRTGPLRSRSAGRKGRRRNQADPGLSSAHPDERDPQTLDSTLGRFVAEQGWSEELRVHGVFSRWSGLVGAEVAEHVTPEAFADGRLTVRTDSTAWATQMKLLAPQLLGRLNDELGEGTVEYIEVLGPHLPRWTSGRYRVRGRGPRDTFG